MRVVWVWDWIGGLGFVSWATLSDFKRQKPGARWGKKRMLMSVLVGLCVRGWDPPHPTHGCGMPGTPLPQAASAGNCPWVGSGTKCGGLPHSPSRQSWCGAPRGRAGARETYLGALPSSVRCRWGSQVPRRDLVTHHTNLTQSQSITFESNNRQFCQREKYKTNAQKTLACMWVKSVLVSSGDRSTWGLLFHI